MKKYIKICENKLYVCLTKIKPMKIIKFTLLITFIFSQLSVQSQKNFEGVITFIENQSKELYSARIKRWANSFMDKVNCETCGGSRLNKQSNFFKISNKTIHDLNKLDIIDLKK